MARDNPISDIADILIKIRLELRRIATVLEDKLK